MAYTTDLTVPQFERLEQLLPQSRTFNSVISRHEIINAIVYQLKNGCRWRDLPDGFPNWQTVYSQCAAVAARRNVGKSFSGFGAERAQNGKKNEFPSLLIGERDVREKYGHGKHRNEGLWLVQSNQRNQTAFIGGCRGSSLFCALHESQRQRRPRDCWK